MQLNPEAETFSMPFNLRRWLQQVVQRPVNQAHDISGGCAIYRIYLIGDGEIIGWQESFRFGLRGQTAQVEIIGPTEESCLKTKNFIEAAVESEGYYETLPKVAPVGDVDQVTYDPTVSIEHRDATERTPHSLEAYSIPISEDGTSAKPSTGQDSNASSESGWGAAVDSKPEHDLPEWLLDGWFEDSRRRDDDGSSFVSNPYSHQG